MSTYQLLPGMVLECFDDGALILDLKKVTFIELNSTAGDILRMTDGKSTVQDVARGIADEYEINMETALQDVTELYRQLCEQGIVESAVSFTEKEG